MNPFFNKEENRPRAGLRCIFFVFFTTLTLGIGNSLPLNGLEYVLTAVLIGSISWFFFRFIDNRNSVIQLGIQLSKSWWKELGFGVGIGFLSMMLIFAIEWLFGDLEVIGFGWNSIGNRLWFWPVLLFLIQMISVGFYEEIITRSYLITNLKEGFTVGKVNPIISTFLAIIVSSSIFGIGHIGNPNVTIFAIINILFAGVMLAIPYVISGKLSYSIGLHLSWNFFQGGVFGFRVSGMPIRNSIIQIQQEGNPIWTGGSFGPEGGLIGLFAILIISILFLIYFKKKGVTLDFHSIFKKTYSENEQTFRKTDELA